MPGSPTDGEGAASRRRPGRDYLWFVDLALGQMAAIVEELGDDLANRRPPVPRRQLGLRHPDPLPGRHGVLGRRHGGRAPDSRATAPPSSRPAATSPSCCGGPSRPAAGCARTSPGSTRRPRRPTSGPTPTTRCPTPRPRAPCWCTSSRSCSSTWARWSSPATLSWRPASMSDDCAPGVPIACSLDAGSLGERVEEWRALVASSVVSVELRRHGGAPGPGRLRRRPDGGGVAGPAREAVLPLLRRVSIGPGSRSTHAVAARCPDGAEEVLAAFVAMLRS